MSNSHQNYILNCLGRCYAIKEYEHDSIQVIYNYVFEKNKQNKYSFSFLDFSLPTGYLLKNISPT